MIVAKRNVPVRLKFNNYLPKGLSGDLFIPVDPSVMGAGMGPAMLMAHMVEASGKTVSIMTMEPHGLQVGDKVTLKGFQPKTYNGSFTVKSVPSAMDLQIELASDPGGNPTVIGELMENYTDNRAVVHLHGGRTPWISDGTPHQWITPAGEDTSYPQGVSVMPVPDMLNTDPGDPRDGSMTYYYTNQQSARLMFYHDHVYGITRLNVYAGEAAGYMIEDNIEQALVASGVIPSEQIPLIIQDKIFVDANTIGKLDPTWRWGTGTDDDLNGYPDFNTGDLWVPHVYMPAQNPYDISGMAAMGRWHYGPWFWPPTTGISHQPIANPYYNPDVWPWQPAEIPDVPDPSMGMEAFNDTPLVNGTVYPTLTIEPKPYRLRILNAANDRFWNLQLYEADSTVTTSDGRTHTEVKMVPAVPNPSDPTWPADYEEGNPTWPIDGRDGGVPDWNTRGPKWIQIGTEGGFLPMPVEIVHRPIDWNVDVTTFNAGLVNSHALVLGPAERADVIVDFSAYAGKTLILYNDAPAAYPSPDARYDYFTGMPDMRDTGGHDPTEAGFGPNTRTIMQIKVEGTPTDPFDLPALEAVWKSTETQDGVFKRAQDPLIVAQGELLPGYDQYNKAYNATFPTRWPDWGISRIHDTSLRFKTIEGNVFTIPMERKAIQDEMGETFDDYGRMSGKLGLQLPNPQAGGQTFVLQSYVDPTTEVITASMTPLTPAIAGDGTQIWKITHNGVDTHPIHFHFFDVQLINRVGWDNGVTLPDANELGWKETIRVSPLEDTIVALRPVAPKLPFKLPDSVRLLDPTMPEGATWPGFDPITANPITVTNAKTNFGWEYMWHCHILSHEEMEMMRPISFHASPAKPTALTAAPSTTFPVFVTLDWTNNATLPAVTNWLIERATDSDFTQSLTTFTVADPSTTDYTDTAVAQGATYFYRVRAENEIAYSVWTGSASATTLIVPPAAPTSVQAAVTSPTIINITWTDNSDNESGFRIERAVLPGEYSAIGTTPANATEYSDDTTDWGVTYSYRVVAFNAAGDAASDPVSAQITGSALPVLGQVRAIVPDNETVNLTDLVVTGVFPDTSSYYVVRLDRSAGIRVESTTLPTVGQIGSLTGTIITAGGERKITDGVFTPSGSTTVPKPLFLPIPIIGGGSAGLVPGMTGMIGLNNVGQLVRTFGTVGATSLGSFTLTDGTSSIKVVVPAGVTAPLAGQMVALTGNCSVEASGADFLPVLLVRDQSDLQVLPQPATADAVLNWNGISINSLKSAAQTSVIASRTLAMVHAAIYDSVNSITGGYQAYRTTVPDVSGASKEAAVASAAHRVLSGLFPTQSATLDAALAASLSPIPDGQAKTDGITAGQTVADAMLTWRSMDHSMDMTHFMGGTAPGQWRPTPPAYAMGMMPQWALVTPWAMTSGTQFRLPTPPALDSAEYATAVNETKSIGMKNSLMRTAEQTQIAYFWADSPGTVTTVGRWNIVARDAAIARSLTLEQNARLFAMLNVSLADAGISSWDSKYFYALWRPITAIREAASDGNALTDADLTWEPELMNPAFPEYASAHSTFSGAGAEVLKRFFGTDNAVFSIPSLSNPAAFRSYGSFTQAADEAGISRIYGGIHYRFSDLAGNSSGRSVTGYVFDNYFQPTP